jgi:hypothetical protein
MGQLINPLSFRLNKNKFWVIRWSTFLKTSFKYILKDDYLIFSFLNFLFYRLKKLLKKKFFFLIIDFIILKKKNLYLFLVDYVFLHKFYKKYFRKIKKLKKIKKLNKNFITNKLINYKKKFLFINFFYIYKFISYKIFNFKKFKLNIYRNLKKIKIRKKKFLKKKIYLKKIILKKKNLILARNFYKKFFILFFFKNFNYNIIALILIFLIIYKKKIKIFFINNPFFIFKFIKSFLILNIKKFLKNNLNLYISYNIIIKLKNIENIFFIKKKVFNNLKLFFEKYNFLKKKFLTIKRNCKIKKNFFFKCNLSNILIKKKKFFLLKKKIINKKKKNFLFILPQNKEKNFFSFILKKNYNNNNKDYRKNSLIKILKKLYILKIKNKLKKKKKKKIFFKIKNKKILYIFFNFNLKIFSIFFKFLFKKYRYNTNKILKLLENKLISFIKLKTFIKGFKIKIKGRFTQKSRSSLSLKNVGKYSLSKIKNKIIYFEENISTIYGISSFKLFFLIDNHFFNKKNDLNKKILNNF